MKINHYIREALRDCAKELNIFKARNSKYASDLDIFENTKKMAEIARILDIDVRRSVWDAEMFYLIGKLVRACKEWSDENYHDGVNYWRRAHYASKDSNK